jgi:AcrR family transcriptional regulator
MSEPEPPKSEETPYREAKRRHVLEVSEALAANAGLGGLQARRIADASKCSVGTLYNLFGDLDSLIIAINGRTLGALGQSLELTRGSKTGRPLLEQLIALAIAYLEFAAANTNRWRTLFEHRMETEQAVPKSYRTQQEQLFAIVEGVIAESQAPPAECRRYARALFASVHGIVSIGLDQKLGPFDHTETEAQVRFVVTAVAGALQRRADGATA